MSKAVVLLSGGIDSTTVMEMAAREHEDLVAVSLHYGQKHSIEIKAAINIAAFFKAEHIVAALPEIFSGAGSTLIEEDLEQPRATYEELRSSTRPSPTVVPFRNANLLSAATTIAIVEKAQVVYAGMHATDAHNWAYPDCTPEFLGAMANAIYVGSYRKVRLAFPLIWETKDQVVSRGLIMGVPLHLTHSCYAGIRPQCGTCPTCVERIHAFKHSSIVDPVPYAIYINWEKAIDYYDYSSFPRPEEKDLP